MSRIFVKQSTLHSGILSIPPSKSHTMRALLFGALGKGKSLIDHYLASPDTDKMIEACKIIGAKIEKVADQLAIQGVNGALSIDPTVINAGNSGIILRFCSALCALNSQPLMITGDYSIKSRRPMHALLHGLKQLGASAFSIHGNDFAPVIIKGPLRFAHATINGEDSQFVSGLLMAAAFAKHPITLNVQNPGEKPWVEMTLNWFDRLGISYTNERFECYKMQGNADYGSFQYTVPGDFSSAAFPIAAALITRSELTLKNMDMNDCQGDKQVIAVFQKMGALIEYDADSKVLHIRKNKGLTGMELDVNDYIDAVPILAVVACFAEGETRLKNAAVARQKECNRLHCLVSELSKMGATILEQEDGLIIKKSLLKGTQVSSYRDHRMALALAVAGLGAKGETCIDSASCISKTFSTFVQDFCSLGAHIREMA